MAYDSDHTDANGEEASFEAMRMVLRNDAKLVNMCVAGSSACTLNWRDGATKVIMHVTDEDSDMPWFSENREPGMESIDNTFCVNYYNT